MAESPAPSAATPAEPSAPAPITSLADLDARMAAIAASPPAADDSDAPEQGATPRPSTPAPAPPTEPAKPEQGDVQEEGEEPSAEGQPKPGGRFAKLRDQLTQTEERARTIEQQLQQRDQQYQDALRQFVDLVLPDAQFEALRVQAEGGDWEAKQKLDLARTWRRMVAPIADVAHHAAKQQFDQALAELRTLDGMDGDAHQKLVQAATPGEKIKLAWELGKKVADADHKDRIAALEAEVQTLKTNKAANGAQPAAGGRASNGSAALAGWLGADGLPTEEAIAAARNGAFRDLGVPG